MEMDDLESKSYLDLLKHPAWQKKRLVILQRDNFTCCVCESNTKTLHVHHTFYAKGMMPWEYPDKTLLTVCEDCHKTHYHRNKNG
jgi:5-methylcytosine-specific restriction endonuclease McrA